MDIKNPLPVTFSPSGDSTQEGQRIISAKRRSEHKQRSFASPLRKIPAHRTSLTAAVHVLTSLMIRYLVQNRGYYTILPEKVKPFG